RVVHVTRSVDGPWVAKPIAGTPGAAGAFPNLTSCQDCWSPSGTFLDSLAVDPNELGKVYVGTEAGMQVGTPDASGNYQWQTDPDIPETWVTTTVARESASGA